MKSPKISRKKPPAIYTSPLSPEIFEFKASENELSASLKQAAQLHREECNDYVDIDAIQAFTEGYNSRQKKDTQQE
jgi:ABC-type transporter MlaC component